MTRAAARLLAAVAFCAPGLAHAQDNVRSSVDVTPAVGYSTNPFSGLGSNVDSGLATINIAPRIEIRGERSTLALTGAADFTEYSRRFQGSSAYRTALDYSMQPGERWKTRIGLNADSSILGAFDAAIYNPAAPGVSQPNDVGVFGNRDRRTSFGASGDFTNQMSDRSTLTGSAFVTAARYRNFPQLSNYDAYGYQFGYSRALSEYVQLGAQGAISFYDYRGQANQTRVASLNGSATVRVNQFWTLDATAGATFIRGGSLASTRQTSFSGSAHMCYKAEQSRFCLDASRSAQPTGYSGVQYVTGVGASYSRKLSEADSISVDGGYSHQGSSSFAILPGLAADYARASVGYSRRLGERLNLRLTGTYRDIFGGGVDRRADIGARIGLSYRLGDLQ